MINLIYLYIFIMRLLMSTSASPRSTVHTLFVDPSEDPFLDPYIVKVSYMNTKDIMAIPKMSDHQFLQSLVRDNSVATRRNAAPVDTSIFDPLRDAQLERQSDIDKEWETLMVSGPLVVQYVGNLMVLASNEDFPLRSPPGYIYRYVRYPNSMRATLAQVSTEMYNALMGAHTAMDQIQLAIKQIPTHVKTAMKLITSASDTMLKSMLPHTLESIGRLANESAIVANSTLLRFNQLQDLLGEIIELSESTRSENEKDIKQLEIQKNNSIVDQKNLENALNTIKEQYAKSQIELENARRDYAQAMKDLKESNVPILVPDGSSGPNLLTAAIGLVFNPVETIGNILGGSGTPKYRVDNSKYDHAMEIAQLAKQALEKAEQTYNAHVERQLADQNNLAKIINDMALLDFTKLNTEEIVRLLLQATKHIQLIREQWARMIQFFSKLAVQAHRTQQVVVYDFVQVIQQAQDDNLLVNPFDREFFVEILLPAATTIESGAHLLFTMAKTYYTVSSEYMINQIAGIGKMLLLQTSEERTAQVQQTRDNTLVTSMKIRQLAQDRHDLYLQETHNRQAEYTAYMDSLANFNLTEITVY